MSISVENIIYEDWYTLQLNGCQTLQKVIGTNYYQHILYIVFILNIRHGFFFCVIYLIYFEHQIINHCTIFLLFTVKKSTLISVMLFVNIFQLH